ncbi:hypothetical protein KFE25_006489 [Diacronema lutheri]|uniref:CRAL-TRIO domain-containing protein n=2 Tax=Diacronema lutheri TaxID=2081491 RepID=A0A8J6CEV1_DIALT|nr:hypothetical protein KFE25_006489 [Diacronema lutheri]
MAATRSPQPRALMQRTSSSFAAALSPSKLREETETNLDVLLVRYADAITRMRQSEVLKPLLLDPLEHDDVFLLRHVLSTKGQVDKAIVSAEQCITWRRDNASLLARADDLHRTVKEILPVGMLPHASTLDQPIQVVMPFQVDLERFARASLDWHFETGIANREVAFRLCDKITRQKRKLIKVVLLQDLSGLTFSFAYSQYRLGSVQGKLSKISSFVYPQMLATVVIVNAPSFINALLRMGSKFLAQKVLDKMKVCSSVEQVCVAANLPYDRLPSFLGGGYDWDAAWIPERLRVAGRRDARERASRASRTSEPRESAAVSAGAHAGGAPSLDLATSASAPAVDVDVDVEVEGDASATVRIRPAAEPQRRRLPAPFSLLAILALAAAFVLQLSAGSMRHAIAAPSVQSATALVQPTYSVSIVRRRASVRGVQTQSGGAAT